MKRVLIRCGWLVTLDPDVGDFKGGELLSRQPHRSGGRNLDAAADEMIDATDKIVMPGLVNAHMHTWETALRGIGAEWMTADYLRHMHLNLATRYRPEDNYLGNLIGALAQIDAGVTTLVDWCHNITGIELAERAVDGLIDSGIRAVFAHGTAKPPTAEGARPFTDIPHPRERIEALRKGRLAGDDGRVTLAMAILGPDWGSWEVVEHDIRMARELGLVSSSHTRRREDCVVPDGYRRMAEAGLLGPDHNLVHGTSYDAADLKLIVDHGASLTSTVLVELHHHIGDTQVAAFRAAGGLPSLGIDVEPFTTGHMFREMQAALLFARGKEIRNNALRGNSPFRQLPVRSREALEWATIGGARAFLMDGKIGTLSPARRPTSSCCALTTSTWPRSTIRSIRSWRSRAPAMSTPSSSTELCASRTASSRSRQTCSPAGSTNWPCPARASCARRATAWRAHRTKKQLHAHGVLPSPLWGGVGGGGSSSGFSLHNNYCLQMYAGSSDSPLIQQPGATPQALAALVSASRAAAVRSSFFISFLGCGTAEVSSGHRMTVRRARADLNQVNGSPGPQVLLTTVSKRPSLKICST